MTCVLLEKLHDSRPLGYSVLRERFVSQRQPPALLELHDMSIRGVFKRQGLVLAQVSVGNVTDWAPSTVVLWYALVRGTAGPDVEALASMAIVGDGVEVEGVESKEECRRSSASSSVERALRIQAGQPSNCKKDQCGQEGEQAEKQQGRRGCSEWR